MKKPKVKFEISSAGVGYTRHQEPGAIPNGSPVRKIKEDPGDGHPIGWLGKVIGSLYMPPNESPQFPDGGYGYFVEWKGDSPGLITFVVGTKIEAVT